MSDNMPRGPLFPPRPEDAPAAPLPPPPPPGVDLAMAAKIERGVLDVFNKHFGEKMLPYAQARVLIMVERDVIGELVRSLAKAPS